MIAHRDLVQFFDGSTMFRWRERLWRQFRIGQPVWCLWCARPIYRGDVAYRPIASGSPTRICMICIDELLADQPPAPHEAPMKEQDENGRRERVWRAEPPKRDKRS